MALSDITMSDVIKTFKTIGLSGNVPPGYTFTFYDKIEESVDDEMFGLNGRINSMIAKPVLLESVLQLDYLGLYVSSKYKIDDMEANFLYTFSPKEINARTTDLYYTLKEKKYTKEQYREVIDSLEKKIWNFDHRRELASSGYVYDPSRELSAEKDWSLTKNYWSLITLFDRMIYHIYRIENMSPTSQMLFVKKLTSLLSDNKNIRKFFRDSGADIADRVLINDCFGIKEDMSTSKAIKRILEKANIILKKFVSRLRVVLSDLEAGSDDSLVL